MHRRQVKLFHVDDQSRFEDGPSRGRNSHYEANEDDGRILQNGRHFGLRSLALLAWPVRLGGRQDVEIQRQRAGHDGAENVKRQLETAQGEQGSANDRPD